MKGVIQIGKQEITDEELFPLLTQYGMLPQLAREVIVDRAVGSIECTPEEENFARNRFYQQNQLFTEEQVKEWLARYGMTMQQLQELSLKEFKLEKFKHQTWGNKLESYFIQYKSRLDRVVYSLLRTKNPGLAQELYFRIQGEECTFGELAKKYSEGSEAETEGLIGPVELHVPHPQISQMLIASKPGQLWPPTQVGEWIIIVKLEKYIGSQLDEATRNRLLNELFNEWLREKMQGVKFFISPQESSNLLGSSESEPMPLI
ncbi:MAG: hypothetical protein N5P05_002807 [Chroococcopsis gigantea SAG 12.99]|jgi:parvulin-like peptidyl-prolyl isomerase|nr:peptidylprolyl isomerase [Chlorogloea purpurea SAG 13.99]MDV3001201.1 hypothetical protein [Chroococcopsis gigantea SAG 12.99]